MANLDFPPFKYTNVTAAGTSALKTQAGMLHGFTINTAGTAATTVQLFDNTSATGATLIATIDGTSTNTYIYDVAFKTGLSVNASSTINATIAWF